MNDGVCRWGGRAAESLCALRVSAPTGVSLEHRRGRCPHRPANNHRTDRRRVRDAAPYGGAERLFVSQCAAARGCNEYEILVASLVDDTINIHQSRAARYRPTIAFASSANTTPVLRDVRRAKKIFSYTVHGAFFFISEKEWGVHPWHRGTGANPAVRAANAPPGHRARMRSSPRGGCFCPAGPPSRLAQR